METITEGKPFAPDTGNAIMLSSAIPAFAGITATKSSPLTGRVT